VVSNEWSLFFRSEQDILNQAVIEVSSRLLYDIEKNREAFRHGPLDPRLVCRFSCAKFGPDWRAYFSLEYCRESRANQAYALPATSLYRPVVATLAMSGFRCLPFISDTLAL
jgi:hypothetical protein